MRVLRFCAVEVGAGQHLHRDEQHPAVLAAIVDGHDVRMRQAADAARLLQPVAEVARVDVGTGQQQLDRDLALEARIEGQPAKNPSFWIRSVTIMQRYGRTGQFWLPSLNHSVAQARIFGKTEVVIEYSDYATNVREAKERHRAAEEMHQ